VKKRHFDYTNHFQPEAQVAPPDASHISVTKDDPHAFNDNMSHNIAIIARMARITIAWRASEFEYHFRFVDGANRERFRFRMEPYSDGVCVPDSLPDKNWELWALQIVRTPEWNSCGLMVIPEESRKRTWRRVGYYETFCFRDMEIRGNRTQTSSHAPLGERVDIILI